MSGLDPSRWGDAAEIRSLRRPPSYQAPPPPAVTLPSVSAVKAAKNKKKKERKKKGQALKGQALSDSNLLQRRVVKLLFDLKKSRVPADKLQALLLVDPKLKSIPVSRKDIPFDLANFFKGTQNPTFRLYIALTNITLPAAGGGTPYNTVFVVEGAALGNFTDFGLIFDEYRVISGMIEYRRQNMVNNNKGSTGADTVNAVAKGIAVVDYDDSTPLAAMVDANLYDTKKFVNFMNVNVSEDCIEDNEHDVARWPLLFEKLPDQDWIDTSTGTTDFAYWKPVIDAGFLPSITAVVGMISGWVDVQYRGEH